MVALSTAVYQSVRVIPWKLFCEITIEFYMQVKRGNWIRINSYHGVLLHRKSPRFVLVANYLFLNPLTGAIQVRGRDSGRQGERERENYHEFVSSFPFFHFSAVCFSVFVRGNKCLPAMSRIMVRATCIIENVVWQFRVSNRPIFHNVPETIQPIANVEFDCRLQKERRILRFSLEIIAQLKR